MPVIFFFFFRPVNSFFQEVRDYRAGVSTSLFSLEFFFPPSSGSQIFHGQGNGSPFCLDTPVVRFNQPVILPKSSWDNSIPRD